MDGYLLDTCAVCAYWDEGHPLHSIVKLEIDALQDGAPRFISRITLAEIEFGILLDEVVTGTKSARATAILARAQDYPIREVSKHTAHEYAELRKNIATTFLAKFVRSNRPRWVDKWLDRVTGELLQIDENDVWICAQAREVNLVVITTDGKMVDRVTRSDPLIQFKLLVSA